MKKLNSIHGDAVIVLSYIIIQANGALCFPQKISGLIFVDITERTVLQRKSKMWQGKRR